MPFKRKRWKDDQGTVHHGTICWTCKNSTPNVHDGHWCEWSVAGKPVEGWTAENRTFKDEGMTVNSYEVYACPKYDWDGSKNDDVPLLSLNECWKKWFGFTYDEWVYNKEVEDFDF